MICSNRSTLYFALPLLLLLASPTYAQVCAETAGGSGPTCDMTYRNTEVTCDAANPGGVFGTRPACPNKPMPMLNTPKRSPIADYSTFLYTFPRDAEEPSRPYSGAYATGTVGDASKTFQLFGNSSPGAKRLAPCSTQMKLPTDVAIGSADDAKFIRLQADNCSNEYILNAAMYPFQKENAKLISGEDPANPGKLIDLQSECQPLRMVRETSDEYKPSTYFEAAWKKTLQTPEYRKTTPDKFKCKPCADDGKPCDREPHLPCSVKLEKMATPPNPFPEVRLSDIDKIQYEEINDPTHPFSPRWDFLLNDWQYGLPHADFTGVPQYKKILDNQKLMAQYTEGGVLKDAVFCAGMKPRGKPNGFGSLGGIAGVGFGGNPLSAVTSAVNGLTSQVMAKVTGMLPAGVMSTLSAFQQLTPAGLNAFISMGMGNFNPLAALGLPDINNLTNFITAAATGNVMAFVQASGLSLPGLPTSITNAFQMISSVNIGSLTNINLPALASVVGINPTISNLMQGAISGAGPSLAQLSQLGSTLSAAVDVGINPNSIPGLGSFVTTAQDVLNKGVNLSATVQGGLNTIAGGAQNLMGTASNLMTSVTNGQLLNYTGTILSENGVTSSLVQNIPGAANVMNAAQAAVQNFNPANLIQTANLDYVAKLAGTDLSQLVNAQLVINQASSTLNIIPTSQLVAAQNLIGSVQAAAANLTPSQILGAAGVTASSAVSSIASMVPSAVPEMVRSTTEFVQGAATSIAGAVPLPNGSISVPNLGNASLASLGATIPIPNYSGKITLPGFGTGIAAPGFSGNVKLTGSGISLSGNATLPIGGNVNISTAGVVLNSNIWKDATGAIPSLPSLNLNMPGAVSSISKAVIDPIQAAAKAASDMVALKIPIGDITKVTSAIPALTNAVGGDVTKLANYVTPIAQLASSGSVTAADVTSAASTIADASAKLGVSPTEVTGAVQALNDAAEAIRKPGQGLLEVPVDVLEFRRPAFEEGLFRRTNFNEACYSDNSGGRIGSEGSIKGSSYCYIPLPKGIALSVNCWQCFGLPDKKKVDYKNVPLPPCSTDYVSPDLSIQGYKPGAYNNHATLAQCNHVKDASGALTRLPRDEKYPYAIDKLCRDLRKPVAIVNKLKMRYHNPSEKSTVVLKEGALEGLTFKEYFKHHMPYPKLWDTGTSLQKSNVGGTADSSNQDPMDTSGQWTAIVGIGREAAPDSAGAAASKYTDQRCKIAGWGGAAGSSVDFGGLKIPLPDPMTSWTEMKLYQTRTLRSVNVSCLGRYEKTFKTGSAENLLLMKAGLELPETIVTKCKRGPNGTTQNCTYMTAKEYKAAGTPKSDNETVYQIQYNNVTYPESWRGYMAATKPDEKFPHFGGGKGSTITGLDKAVAGDIIMMPYGPGNKPEKPGLAKLALVTFAHLPSNSDCTKTKDCYLEVEEPDNGKWPDSCGVTDTSGEVKTRRYYKPGMLPTHAAEEYKRIKSTNDCEETRLQQCEMSAWDKLELYRIQDDKINPCDKAKSSDCE